MCFQRVIHFQFGKSLKYNLVAYPMWYTNSFLFITLTLFLRSCFNIFNDNTIDIQSTYWLENLAVRLVTLKSKSFLFSLWESSLSFMQWVTVEHLLSSQVQCQMPNTLRAMRLKPCPPWAPFFLKWWNCAWVPFISCDTIASIVNWVGSFLSCFCLIISLSKRLYTSKLFWDH